MSGIQRSSIGSVFIQRLQMFCFILVAFLYVFNALKILLNVFLNLLDKLRPARPNYKVRKLSLTALNIL